jgi:hypothetical protein
LDILKDIIRLLFGFVLEILFSWTGECVLFITTLGRHKPRWDIYAKESPSRFVIFSEISLWIGVAFWMVMIAVIYKLMAKGQ